MTKTFKYDDKLPSLPLPTLEHTLNRYLDSGIRKINKNTSKHHIHIYIPVSLVRAVVNDDEYVRTKKIVERFAEGIGRELHEQLKAKIEERQERNWVSIKNIYG